MKKQILYYVIIALGSLCFLFWIIPMFLPLSEYIPFVAPRHEFPKKPEPEQISTSTTKTYRNESFGFQFDYPARLYVKENHNPYVLLYVDIGGGMLNPYALTVEKTSAPDITQLTDYVLREDMEEKKIREERYVILAGEKAKVMTFEKNFGSRSDTYIQLIHKGYLFSCLTWKDGAPEDFTKLFLDTFSFFK